MKQTGASRFPGNGEFRGENRPYGALITYSLNVEGLPHPNEEVERERRLSQPEEPEAEAGAEERSGDDGEPKVTLEITDADGKVIRSFESPAKLGVNRTAWDLRRDAFKRPRGDEPSFFQPSGAEVLPGIYGVRVKYGDHEATGSVRVLADPRFDIPDSDRRAKFAAVMHAGALQEAATEMIERIRATRDDIDGVVEKAKDSDETAASSSGTAGDGANDELIREARELEKKLGELERKLWVPPDTKGIVADLSVFPRVGYVSGSLGSSWDAPTPAQQAYLRAVESQLAAVLAEFSQLFEADVTAFRERVEAAGIEFLKPKPPLSMPER